MRVSNRLQNFLCCCTDFRAFSCSHLFPHLRQASVSSSGMFRRARGFSLRQREMSVCSSQSTHQTPHYTVCFYMCVCVWVCAVEWKWTTYPERGNRQRRKRFVKWFEMTDGQRQMCDVQTGWDAVFLIWKKINHFRVFAQVQYH